jgi:hypothetical protein
VALLQGAPALTSVVGILEALEGGANGGGHVAARIIEAATTVDGLLVGGASAESAAAQLSGRRFDGGTVRAMAEVLANRSSGSAAAV